MNERKRVGSGVRNVIEGRLQGQRASFTSGCGRSAHDPASGSLARLADLPAGIHGIPAAGYEGTAFVTGGSDRAGGMDNQGRVLKHIP